MEKLPCVVVSSTGEDAEYSAQELNTHSTHTKGWQSPKFCEYPQELTFLVNRGRPSRISQLQILSHENKISTRIEVLIGNGKASDSSSFRRLGYTTFDSNEESHFQARELKSIKIDEYDATFVKLIIHPCHVNNMNLFNQVGIVAVNLTGQAIEEAQVTIDDSFQPIHHETPHHNLSDFSVTIGSDRTSTLAQLMHVIQTQQEEAVGVEDFDHAMTLKAHEKAILAAARELYRLTLEKKRAVLVEDFESAKYIKIDIDRQQAVAQRVADFVYQDLEQFTLEQKARGAAGAHERNENGRVASGALVHALPHVEQEAPPPQRSEASEQQSNPHWKGVPKADTLPEPELVSNAVLRDYGELIQTFGEYLIRSALSRHPSLREAALIKIKLGLSAFSERVLSQLFVMVEIGLSDSNLRVFVAGCELIQGVLRSFVDLPSTILHAELKPMLQLLSRKLGHSQPRMRDAAAVTILSIADHGGGGGAGGPVFVVSTLLSQFGGDEDASLPWQTLRSVLRLFRAIVLEHHCHVRNQTQQQLSAKSIMQFLELHEAHSHANEKVRQAACELSTAVYLDIGPKIEKYLGSLRQVQMDEYYQAFDRAQADGDSSRRNYRR